MNYKNINDYEILYMVKENSDDASRNLIFEKYFPIMKNLAFKYYSANKDLGADYEDYIQESMIAFNRAIINYDEYYDTLFYTYAPAVINNHLRTFVRNLKVKKHQFLNSSVRSIQVLNNFQDCTNFLGDRKLETELIEFKNSLDFCCSNVFELRYNGFNYREISMLLDIPISTVQSRLSKIKRILHTKLQKTI